MILIKDFDSQIKLISGIWNVKPKVLPKKELSRITAKIRNVLYNNKERRFSLTIFKIKVLSEELSKTSGWNEFKTVEQNLNYFSKKFDNFNDHYKDFIIIAKNFDNTIQNSYFYTTTPEKCKKYLTYLDENPTSETDSFSAFKDKVIQQIRNNQRIRIQHR